jgi:hypothetical protein
VGIGNQPGHLSKDCTNERAPKTCYRVRSSLLSYHRAITNVLVFSATNPATSPPSALKPPPVTPEATLAAPRLASATDAVRTATSAETVLRVVPQVVPVDTRVVPLRVDSGVVRLVTTAGTSRVPRA